MSPQTPPRKTTFPPGTGPNALTVLEALQQPNPKLTDHWEGSSYSSSTGSFDNILFNKDTPTVKPWTDFTFDAIHLAYGDLLDMSIGALDPNYTPPAHPIPGTPSAICDEVDVDNKAGEKWSSLVIRTPIKGAAAKLRPRLSGTATTNPTLKRHPLTWTDAKKAASKLKPDWAIVEYNIPLRVKYREEPPKKPPQRLVYVVGDSKLKQKWKSEWLALKGGPMKVPIDPPFGSTAPCQRSVEDERLWPLRKVATYCRYGQTRYAFLITQKELVALRIRRVEKMGGTDAPYAAVEYASVPWEATTGLTINLALWALGCMGMNDEHREMEQAEPRNSPLPAMARLTWWTYDKTAKVYQNVISKRRIPAAEWKKEYNAFVHRDENNGQSFTLDFLPRTQGATSKLPTTVASLTQRVGAMDLGKTTMPAAQSSAPAKTVAAKAAPAKAAASSTPAPTPAPAPAKKVAAKATPAKATASNTPAPVPAPAPAPAPNPTAPNPAGRSMRTATKQCIIGGQTLTATYVSENRTYEVTMGGKVHVVKYETKAKKYTLEHGGKTMDVTWVAANK